MGDQKRLKEFVTNGFKKPYHNVTLSNSTCMVGNYEIESNSFAKLGWNGNALMDNCKIVFWGQNSTLYNYTLCVNFHDYRIHDPTFVMKFYNFEGKEEKMFRAGSKTDDDEYCFHYTLCLSISFAARRNSTSLLNMKIEISNTTSAIHRTYVMVGIVSFLLGVGCFGGCCKYFDLTECCNSICSSLGSSCGDICRCIGEVPETFCTECSKCCHAIPHRCSMCHRDDPEIIISQEPSPFTNVFTTPPERPMLAIDAPPPDYNPLWKNTDPTLPPPGYDECVNESLL